tara:strand:+ start:176 stop:328 length:153 start_codon:yes stop_codon:yes gene_type:complete
MACMGLAVRVRLDPSGFSIFIPISLNENTPENKKEQKEIDTLKHFLFIKI